MCALFLFFALVRRHFFPKSDIAYKTMEKITNGFRQYTMFGHIAWLCEHSMFTLCLMSTLNFDFYLI